MLTFNHVALHGIAQLRNITLHSCGARLFDHFPPATDVDGNVPFFFSVYRITFWFFRVCLRSRSCSLTVCASSLITRETITSTAHACVRQFLRLFHFWVRLLDGDGANIFTLILSRSGLYLTDITFCREGNPSHRASPLAAEKKLINYSKYYKMARIVQGNGIALLEKR